MLYIFDIPLSNFCRQFSMTGLVKIENYILRFILLKNIVNAEHEH